MDEFRDLDCLLEENIPLPEKVLDTVSPWRPAMKKLLWGFLLHSIVIQHWNLNHILPAIGVALLWLGWRSLRCENGWFRAGWLASLVLLVKRFVVLILQATPLVGGWELGWLAATCLNFLLILFQCFCLWRGLGAVFRKAGHRPQTGAALWLLIWYLAVLVLSLWAPQGGNLVFLLMAAAYGGILWAMWRLARCLDEVGYALEPAAVGLPAGKTLLVLVLALAVSIGGCMLAFDRWPEQEEQVHGYVVPVEQQPSALVEINQRLLDLGYPEDLLADLSLEDRYRCQTAVGVDTSTEGFWYDSWWWKSPGQLYMRPVSVVLEDGTCRFFCHFQWTEEPLYRGMESFEVVPTFHDINGQWDQVSGCLLYERDGRVYETSFARLEEIHGPTTCRWGDANFGIIQAEFSLPEDGYSPRGYIAYDLKSYSEDWLNFNMGVAYTRQLMPWVYPWKSPLDHRQLGIHKEDWFFRPCEYWGIFSLNNPNNPAWQAIFSAEEKAGT